jgi:(2Fe-2S) ferredoxin
MGGKKTPEGIEQVVVVCRGEDCTKRGAKRLQKLARFMIKKLGLKRSTHVMPTQCNGMCDHGPIACIQPENEWLTRADENSMSDLIEEHLLPKSRRSS